MGFIIGGRTMSGKDFTEFTRRSILKGATAMGVMGALAPAWLRAGAAQAAVADGDVARRDPSAGHVQRAGG